MAGISMQEVLTIRVILTDSFEVSVSHSMARMITFTGDCDCENFKGEILSGGVDTQRVIEDSPLRLSARYMLQGVDKEGQKCKIFIENNGEDSPDGIVTKPTILTDSQSLSFLHDADLKGTVEPWEKGVIIHIFME